MCHEMPYKHIIRVYNKVVQFLKQGRHVFFENYCSHPIKIEKMPSTAYFSVPWICFFIIYYKIISHNLYRISRALKTCAHSYINELLLRFADISTLSI